MDADSTPEPEAAQIAQWLYAGLLAAQHGETEKAYELLTRVVTHDEAQIGAWWQLSRLVTDPEEQEICLDNVLALDPTHIEALAVKAALQQEYRQAALSTLEQALDRETIADGAFVQIDPFNDPWRCPYCAAATDEDDRACPECHQPLWEVGREIKEPRFNYYLLLGLESVFILTSVLVTLLLLNYAEWFLSALVQLDLNLPLFSIYGSGAGATPELQAALFDILPRACFWLALAPGVLSGLIALSALTRAMPGYITGLSLSGLRIILIISNLLLQGSHGVGRETLPEMQSWLSTHFFPSLLRYYRIALGGANFLTLIAALALFLLFLNLTDHFALAQKRLWLEIDREVRGSALSLWMRGREYFDDHRWAAAALHFRYALALDERVDFYLPLALAYSHLGMYDHAESALADARALAPDNPQITSVTALVSQRRAQA